LVEYEQKLDRAENKDEHDRHHDRHFDQDGACFVSHETNNIHPMVLNQGR